MNGRLRIAVLSGAFAIVLLCELTTFRRWELKRRTLQFVALAPLPLEEASLRGSVFGADPRYGAFLESVARAVPEDAVVALVSPRTDDLSRYTARYALAPRRVVAPDRLDAANFVAVFTPEASPRPAGPVAVAYGTLERLR